MKEFNDKVAVITGGASGIGRGIAERCVSEGMKVVLADIDGADLTKAETELRTLGGTVLTVSTDVSKRGDVERLACHVLDAFGQVHLLFNNAGVAAGGAPWEATWHDWEWVVGVNLWGVIHGVKVFTPLMLAQNTECHIVNTSSAAGLIVGSASAPYAATKHAVVALSESLYLALQGRNSLIKVSVLCPGLVRTNIANAERNRPAELGNEPVTMTLEMQAGRAAFKAALDAGMPPVEVADVVFGAIRSEQFYILTHPEWTEVIQLRTDSLLRMEIRKALQQWLRNSSTPAGEGRNVGVMDSRIGRISTAPFARAHATAPPTERRLSQPATARTKRVLKSDLAPAQSSGPSIYLFSSTKCAARSVALCSVTEKPRLGKSKPANNASPLPSTTGASARCRESISAA